MATRLRPPQRVRGGGVVVVAVLPRRQRFDKESPCSTRGLPWGVPRVDRGRRAYRCRGADDWLARGRLRRQRRQHFALHAVRDGDSGRGNDDDGDGNSDTGVRSGRQQRLQRGGPSWPLRALQRCRGNGAYPARAQQPHRRLSFHVVCHNGAGGACGQARRHRRRRSGR